MAEFKVVTRHRKRMCKHYHSIAENACNSCPIGNANNGYHLGCISFLFNCPQEAEEIIMGWADEHPLKTNADKFKEVFGFECSSYGCDGLKCIHRNEEIVCADCELRNFWDNEYKEPKGDE